VFAAKLGRQHSIGPGRVRYYEVEKPSFLTLFLEEVGGSTGQFEQG
jgi:hypothetical protein